MKNYGFDVAGELAEFLLALSDWLLVTVSGWISNLSLTLSSPQDSSGKLSSPVSGEFDINEWYAEVSVLMTENLELSAAQDGLITRALEAQTNKIGLTYSAELITFNYIFGGIQAPGIGIYGGNSDSYPDLADPCDVNASNFTGSGNTQAGRCASDGTRRFYTTKHADKNYC